MSNKHIVVVNTCLYSLERSKKADEPIERDDYECVWMIECTLATRHLKWKLLEIKVWTNLLVEDVQCVLMNDFTLQFATLCGNCWKDDRTDEHIDGVVCQCVRTINSSLEIVTLSGNCWIGQRIDELVDEDACYCV